MEYGATPGSSDARRLVGGRFHLLARLGSGAAGAVWRAIDAQSGEEVALKLLHDAGSNATRLARFEREAELTRAIDHPGIVRVLDAGFVGEDTPFIAYELIEGAHTLAQVLPLAGLRRRVELVRDVARAAGAAHARGVVHRDLKAENVLVDAAGQIRVADFGLAGAEGLERLTRTGTLLGTPLSMAPEQLRGSAVGPPTDVWALGVLLYQALTGQSPFNGASWPELAASIAAARPAPPRQVVPDVPPELEAICLGALQVDPGSRPADGEALARQLDGWLLLVASTASGIEPPGPAPASQVAARWPLLLLLLAAAPWLVLGLTRGARPDLPAAAIEASGQVPAGEVPASEGPVLSAAPPGAGQPASSAPVTGPDPGTPSRVELQRAAEGGDVAAMFALGEALRDGREGRVLLEPALEWFRRAAERGHPAAMRMLGVAFRDGRGVARDLELAQDWLERAFQARDVEAACELGLLFELGRKDDGRAVEWYRRATEAGSARGRCFLGVMTEHGRGVTKDPPAALEHYARAAEGGYARAAVWRGLCLEFGRQGVERDRKAAVDWYRRAAEMGDAQGMRRWGLALRLGRGVEKDLTAAARWFLRAAEAGDVESMRHTGDAYDDAIGVARDQALAEHWYRRAVELGDVPATNNLGVMLSRAGRHGEALDLFRRAAEGGDRAAMKNLGVSLRDGNGGREKDPRAALPWLRRSAEAGYPDGMLELGRLLRDGPQDLRDPAEARRWLERAADEGSAAARDELAREAQPRQTPQDGRRE